MTDIFAKEERNYTEVHGEGKLTLAQMVEVTGLGLAELGRQKSAETKKLADTSAARPKSYVPTYFSNFNSSQPDKQYPAALMFFVNATGDYVEIYPNYIWELK